MIILDLYMVPRHCIVESQLVVKPSWAPLQATLHFNQHQQLLDQLAIPFQVYLLSQQALLYQLLEKHF